MTNLFHKEKLKRYILTFREYNKLMTKKKFEAVSDIIALMMVKDIIKSLGTECHIITLYNETDNKLIINHHDAELERLKEHIEAISKQLKEMSELIKKDTSYVRRCTESITGRT